MKQIVIATDLGEMAEKVLSTGLELAEKLGLPVTLLTIINRQLDYFPPDTGQAFANQWEARKYLAEQKLAAVKADHKAQHIEIAVSIGDPQRDIIKKSEELEASMIVIGTHGRGGLSHLLMGGTAEYIVRHSTVPVVVVPFRASAH